LSSITGFSREKRLALVIGNSAYEYGGVLKNPVNDANLMSTTLEALGFDVISKINASKGQMDEAMLPWAGLPMASAAVTSVDGDPTMSLMYGAPAVGTLTASFLLCRWARQGRFKAINSYYDNYQGLNISGTNHGVGKEVIHSIPDYYVFRGFRLERMADHPAH
jgi:hypothetical protein